MYKKRQQESLIAFYSNESIFDDLHYWGAESGDSADDSKIDELDIARPRACPMCGNRTISGMRGSMSAICQECGYKDPCCFD